MSKRVANDELSGPAKRHRTPSTQVIYCDVFPCVHKFFSNKGNKTLHDKKEHKGGLQPYNLQPKKIKKPIKLKVKVKRKSRVSLRKVRTAATESIVSENLLLAERLRVQSLAPTVTIGPLSPLNDDEAMDQPFDVEDIVPETNLFGLGDEFVEEDENNEFKVDINANGEDVVGGQVIFNVDAFDVYCEDDDNLLRIEEVYAGVDGSGLPQRYQRYLRWRKSYYKDYLCDGKFCMPPELDLEYTITLAMLDELPVADFADVRMSEINRDLLQLSEVGGLSKQNQWNIHRFLTKYLDENKKKLLLTPPALTFAAQNSNSKGLKFTTFNPLKNKKLAEMYKGAEIPMANLLDAVIMMLKDPEIFGQIVSCTPLLS